MTAFRTHTDAFARANAQVLGISMDSWAAAGEFEAKLGLEFPLVSDFPRGESGKRYGAYNKAYGTMNRLTVVIDRDRIVRDVYLESRDMASHATHALEALRAMGEDPGE